MMKKQLLLYFLFLNQFAYANDSLCSKLGGQIKFLEANYQSSNGIITGFKKPFCVFHIDQGIAVIGLKTMESTKANLAASLIKTLPELDENTTLLKGPYSNPSHNLCKNLGGSFIQMLSYGNFSDDMGDSDICVFGDGSMLSAWTLVYIANGRNGYDMIKNNIPSIPIPLNLPTMSLENN